MLDCSTLTRALYSTDASLYRVVPQAVARPRDVDELLAVLDAARSARGPHALLPIIPPIVQRLCVEGSGPNRSPYGAAAA